MDPISRLEISTHQIESDTFTIMKKKHKFHRVQDSTGRPRQEGGTQLAGMKALREGAYGWVDSRSVPYCIDCSETDAPVVMSTIWCQEGAALLPFWSPLLGFCWCSAQTLHPSFSCRVHSRQSPRKTKRQVKLL